MEKNSVGQGRLNMGGSGGSGNSKREKGRKGGREGGREKRLWRERDGRRQGRRREREKRLTAISAGEPGATCAIDIVPGLTEANATPG